MNSIYECYRNKLTLLIIFYSFEHKKSQAVSKLNKEKLLAYLEVSFVIKPETVALTFV